MAHAAAEKVEDLWKLVGVFGARLLAAILLTLSLSAQTNPPQQPGQQDSTNNGSPDSTQPLDQLNQSLPAWLQFNGQYRNRVERSSGIGYRAVADTYDLSQLRLELSLQPFWWLAFLGETQDAEVFFNQQTASAPPYQNTWDIRQAYVELGNSRKGWFDVAVGRQVLSFGKERVIGPSDWLNMGRTFDAIRADLHHAGYNLSLFASSVIVARDGVIDHHIQGNNLHGAYGRLEKLLPRAALEPYVLWRVAPAQLRLSENAGRGTLNEVTVGFRWQGRLPAHFDYEIEMDKQVGSLGPDSIHAWAGHWNTGWKFVSGPGTPRVYVEGNYASGTNDPNSRTWGTFDQIYPSSHNKLDFADRVGWRNIEQARPGIEETLGRSWKFTETYESFWLASARDAFYGTNGAPVAQSPSGVAGRHIGQEVDGWAEWKYRSVEIGFGYGHLFPGGFLRRTTTGSGFTYPFFYLTYAFTRTPEL
jgi:hypothetical protein